jgi:hypothetical protein
MSKINIYKQKVRIGKLDWDINLLPESLHDELDGRCSTPLKAFIEINPDLDDFNELETVYHEIFHAIEGMRNLDFPEETITMLGNSIACLFVRNPWLITYTNQKVRKILLDC